MDRVLQGHPRAYLPSDIIFPRPAFSDEERDAAEQRLWQIDAAIEAVLTGNHALHTLLTRLGIHPDVIVGHSTGEYSAMLAAGILDLGDEEKFGHFALELNRMYRQEASRTGVPQATLIAVGAERAQVAAIVEETGGDIFVAMDNCPHQTVIVGEQNAAREALEEIRRRGLIYETLSFDRPYHTPLFEQYSQGLRDFFAALPIGQPAVETWSCATAAPYPDDPDEIRRLAVGQWARPVEFARTIEAMYEAGVRLFVEVGPRGNLTAFVDDILRGKPCLAVPANVQRRSGITQLNHMLALLAAQGVEMQLDYLYMRRAPQRLNLEEGAEPAAQKPRSGPIKLNTGWPAMQISEETVRRLRTGAGAQPGRAPAKPAPTARTSTNGGDTGGADQAATPAGPAPASVAPPRRGGDNAPPPPPP